MNHQEARAALTLALLDIRRKMGLGMVPYEVLWAAVSDRLSMSEYTKVLRDLQGSGLAIFENDAIGLTDDGVTEAEKIHERLQESERQLGLVAELGRRGCADDNLDSKGADGSSEGGSASARGTLDGVDVPDDPRAAISRRDEQRDRYAELMSAAVHGLADAVIAHGYAIPHHQLYACVVHRVAHTRTKALGYDAAQASRMLGENRLIALLGTEARLLQRGLRAVSIIFTLEARAR